MASVQYLTSRLVLACSIALTVAGCSSAPQAGKAAELGPNPALVGARLAWTFQLGAVGFPLSVAVNGDRLAVASSLGDVAMIDAKSGAPLWQAAIGSGLSAGVGGDGTRVSVMTVNNEVVVLEAGKELWRDALPAQGFTPPLVAGGRVLVLTADRTVSAFDAKTGRKLWVQQRPGESLVLRQAGALLAVGDTLVAGISGRLVGLDPANGSTRWEASIASPRGTNEVERLVDVVDPVGRTGNIVCARAFQSSVGCVDTGRGRLLWTMPSAGSVGLASDGQFVFGVEEDANVKSWKSSNGELVWQSEQLLNRKLTAPLVLGRSLVVGDDAGLVHLLSREDGSTLARFSTDGSGVASTPVLVGETLVVVSRKGGAYGFRPE
jgi:outer membrane protein assembly factor BamB